MSSDARGCPGRPISPRSSHSFHRASRVSCLLTLSRKAPALPMLPLHIHIERIPALSSRDHAMANGERSPSHAPDVEPSPRTRASSHHARRKPNPSSSDPIQPNPKPAGLEECVEGHRALLLLLLLTWRSSDRAWQRCHTRRRRRRSRRRLQQREKMKPILDWTGLDYLSCPAGNAMACGLIH